MSAKSDHEDAKRAIDRLYSGAYSSQDILLYLKELEDYISIRSTRIEALERLVAPEVDGTQGDQGDTGARSVWLRRRRKNNEHQA